MTVDDQSSIYVGGLAYDVTEELMRKTFDQYGEIVAVKIVQDQIGQSRGYGFVTFTNPEAASDAIYSMNGRAIGGRTIRVNEVKNKGSKIMGRENSFRDRDRRERDTRMSRERERNGRGRYPSPRRSNRRSPLRSGRDRSPVYRRNRSPRNGRSRSPRSSPGSRDSFDRRDDEAQRTRISSEKTGDNLRLKEDLTKVVQSQQDRRDQVSSLENDLKRAYQKMEEMQSKEQKLEDSLASAMAAASHRADLLKKMQRAFLELKDCKDNLKSAEKEFEALMEASMDMENSEIGARDDRYMAHGNGDTRYGEESKRISESQ